MASPAPAPAAVNGNTDASTKEAYLEGMIYPPPDIRSIVDKTASFIAKHPNPAAFTDKIRQREKTDSKFSFLNESDAYHAYYQHRITQFKDGTAGGAGGAATPTAAASAANAAAASGDAVQTANTAIAGAAGELVDEGRPTVPQPRPFEFNNAQRPPMAAVDADILRLTALFTARMGRGFTSDLATREAGNYQFGFLQPSHSFFGYFNRLVEQYTKVLMAPQETLAVLDRQAGYTKEYDDLLSTEAKRKAIARREIMKDVENRVEWTKYDHARRQAEDSKMEEERVAFQSIDWQDFTVATTVDFTEQDELLDLPPPMSRSEVEGMTLAQKKMAAMIMEGKDVATAAVESGAVSREAEDAEMEMSDDEADKLVQRVDATKSIAQEVRQAPGAPGQAPIKIRKDYIPKSQRAKKVLTTACRICGQQIPENEMAEHVRIELLDPRWKEKQLEIDARRAVANVLHEGTDVASSLRQIASKRTDIFSATAEDEARRKAREEEERVRKREREKAVWDGHAASALSTAERFSSGANLDEQIAALHKAKGLTLVESNIGPQRAQIDPEAAAAAAQAEAAAAKAAEDAAAANNPAFLKAPGSFKGATVAAAPQTQQAYQTGQTRPAEQSDDPNKRRRY